MTATLRIQRARSRQAQSGAKRVEVVLDAGQLAVLQQIKDRYDYTTADAISYAISAALVVMARDTPLSS
ncbi:MAG: hypothetical protein ACK528_02035 [Alphaproteobacteria bacterium]